MKINSRAVSSTPTRAFNRARVCAIACYGLLAYVWSTSVSFAADAATAAGDGLAEAATLFGRVGNLVGTSLAVAVLFVGAGLIIGKLIEVYKGRAQMGEVLGSIVLVALVSLFVAFILTFAAARVLLIGT